MIQLSHVESKPVDTLYTLMGEDFDFPITKALRENVDWDIVFSTIESLKTQYNQEMMRFVKSEIISWQIEESSNGYLKYVNQRGYDFVTSDNIKIELKSGIQVFQKIKHQTEMITISNTNGQSTDTKVFVKTFDYLLLVEPGMVGVTSWERMRPYIIPKGDSFKAQIPLKEIEIFQESHTVEDCDICLPDVIREAMRLQNQKIREFVISKRKSNENIVFTPRRISSH